MLLIEEYVATMLKDLVAMTVCVWEREREKNCQNTSVDTSLKIIAIKETIYTKSMFHNK